MGLGPKQDYVIQTGAHAGNMLKDAMTLAPDPGTDMRGRSGAFLIHGSNDYSTQDSSLGCIVMRPSERNTIGGSGVTDLQVVQ